MVNKKLKSILLEIKPGGEYIIFLDKRALNDEDFDYLKDYMSENVSKSVAVIVDGDPTELVKVEEKHGQ